MAELLPLIESVARHCGKRDIVGRTVTLKLRYADFKTVTRSRTLLAPTGDAETMTDVVGLLLDGLLPLRAGVRLLGVTLSNLGHIDQNVGQQLLI